MTILDIMEAFANLKIFNRFIKILNVLTLLNILKNASNSKEVSFESFRKSEAFVSFPKNTKSFENSL